MKIPTAHSRQPKGSPPRSLRLTFTYAGANLQLNKVQPIAMTAPPSESLQPQGQQSGFWVELHDPKGSILYRQIVQNPVKFAYEIHTENPTEALNWQEISAPKGQFTLLVPAIDQAKSVVLFSSPFEPEKAAQPASEILRIDLHQDAEGKEGLR